MKSQFLKPIALFKEVNKERHASWMELFLDLGFVIALSRLEGILENGFSPATIFTYIFVFFIILWIWNRLTWYSSYYGNDDIFYKTAFTLALFFVLGFSSEIKSIEEGYFRSLIYWYLLIEATLISLWIRVVVSTKEFRNNSLLFFVSYLLSFFLVLTSLFYSGTTQYILWGGAILSEFIGPVAGWISEKGKITVHSAHILERHGLFTIILLGEGLVSVLSTLEEGINFDSLSNALLIICTLTLIWSVYFSIDLDEQTNFSQRIKNTFIFGYGQFIVYISILLIIFSFNYQLHGATFIHNKQTLITPARILIFATGSYILSIGSIDRLIINNKRLAPIFYARIFLGILLLILSLIPILYSFISALLLSIFTMVVCILQQTRHLSQTNKNSLKM